MRINVLVRASKTTWISCPFCRVSSLIEMKESRDIQLPRQLFRPCTELKYATSSGRVLMPAAQ